MERLLQAGAMALAVSGCALAMSAPVIAQVAQTSTEVAAGDALAMAVSIVGTILSAVVGLGLELLHRKFNMDADSAALNAIRETVDNAILLGEDAAKEFVSGATISIENPHLRGMVGYVLTQAPAEIKRRGYSEQVIANWIMSRTGLLPVSEPVA